MAITLNQPLLNTNTNAISLSWSNTFSSIGYTIYISTSANGPYLDIATVGGGVNGYTDSSSKVGGTTYYYYVSSGAADSNVQSITVPLNGGGGTLFYRPVNGWAITIEYVNLLNYDVILSFKTPTGGARNYTLQANTTTLTTLPGPSNNTHQVDDQMAFRVGSISSSMSDKSLQIRTPNYESYFFIEPSSPTITITSDDFVSSVNGSTFKLYIDDGIKPPTLQQPTTSGTTNLSNSISWLAVRSNRLSDNVVLEGKRNGLPSYSTLSSNASSPYTHSNLLPLTKYLYKASYRGDRAGFSLTSRESNIVSVTTNTQKLSPPNLYSINSSTSSITLTWSDANNGNEDNYVIQWSTSSSFSTITGSTTALSSEQQKSVTNSVLNYNQTYYFRLYANGSGGYTDSNVSNVRSESLDKIQLDTPINLRSIGIGSNQIEIAWNDVSNESGYTIQRMNSSYTLQETKTNGVNVVTELFTGLNSGTTYRFRVKATSVASGSNPYEDSDYTSYLTVTTQAKLATPTLQYINKTDSQIQIRWNNVSGTSRYKIYRNGGVLVADYNAGSTNPINYTNTGLSRNTQYSYYVVALSTSSSYIDSDNSNTITQTTNKTTITAPTLNQSTITDSYIRITWFNVNHTNTFWIYRNGTKIDELSSSSSGIVWVDNNVTRNTQYSYYIVAKKPNNDFLDSDNSNTLTPTTLKTVLTRPNQFSYSKTDSSVTINWNNITNNSGYEIIWNNSTTVTTNTNITTKSFSGLLRNTSYPFSIRALGAGDFESSIYTSTSVTTNKTKLNPPSGLSETNTTYNSLSVSWNSVTNNSGYTVSYNDGSQSGTTFTTNTNTTINGLNTNSTYSVQVRTEGTGDFVDSNYSSPISVKTESLVALTRPNLTVSSTSSSITASWSDVNSNKEDSYTLQYSTSFNFSSNVTTIQNLTKNTSSYVLNNPTVNTSYFFRVKAEASGAYSDSPYSVIGDNYVYLCPLINDIQITENRLETTFSWQASNQAIAYEYKYQSTDGVDIKTYTRVTGTSVTFTPLEGKSYAITVKSICSLESPYVENGGLSESYTKPIPNINNWSGSIYNTETIISDNQVSQIPSNNMRSINLSNDNDSILIGTEDGSWSYNTNTNETRLYQKRTLATNKIDYSIKNFGMFFNNGVTINTPLLNITNQFTISAFVKLLNNNNKRTIAYRTGNYWFGIQNSGSQKVLFFERNGNVYTSNPFNLNNNEFAHVTVSYNGSVIRYYVNNVDYGSRIISFSYPDNSSLVLGSTPSNSFYLGGIMADFRIYDKYFTRTQVKNMIIDKGLSEETERDNLKIHIPFNEGVGTSVKDSSGNYFDGSINFPTKKFWFKSNDYTGDILTNADNNPISIDSVIEVGNNYYMLSPNGLLAIDKGVEITPKIPDLYTIIKYNTYTLNFDSRDISVVNHYYSEYVETIKNVEVDDIYYILSNDNYVFLLYNQTNQLKRLDIFGNKTTVTNPNTSYVIERNNVLYKINTMDEPNYSDIIFDDINIKSYTMNVIDNSVSLFDLNDNVLNENKYEGKFSEIKVGSNTSYKINRPISIDQSTDYVSVISRGENSSEGKVFFINKSDFLNSSSSNHFYKNISNISNPVDHIHIGGKIFILNSKNNGNIVVLSDSDDNLNETLNVGYNPVYMISYGDKIAVVSKEGNNSGKISIIDTTINIGSIQSNIEQKNTIINPTYITYENRLIVTSDSNQDVFFHNSTDGTKTSENSNINIDYDSIYKTYTINDRIYYFGKKGTDYLMWSDNIVIPSSDKVIDVNVIDDTFAYVLFESSQLIYILDGTSIFNTVDLGDYMVKSSLYATNSVLLLLNKKGNSIASISLNNEYLSILENLKLDSSLLSAFKEDTAANPNSSNWRHLRYTGGVDNLSSMFINGDMRGTIYHGGLWSKGVFRHKEIKKGSNDFFEVESLVNTSQVGVWLRGVWLSGYFSQYDDTSLFNEVESGDVNKHLTNPNDRSLLLSIRAGSGLVNDNIFGLSDIDLRNVESDLTFNVVKSRHSFASLFTRRLLRETTSIDEEDGLYFSVLNGTLTNGIIFDDLNDNPDRMLLSVNASVGDKFYSTTGEKRSLDYISEPIDFQYFRQQIKKSENSLYFIPYQSNITPLYYFYGFVSAMTKDSLQLFYNFNKNVTSKYDILWRHNHSHYGDGSKLSDIANPQELFNISNIKISDGERDISSSQGSGQTYINGEIGGEPRYYGVPSSITYSYTVGGTDTFNRPVDAYTIKNVIFRGSILSSSEYSINSSEIILNTNNTTFNQSGDLIINYYTGKYPQV